MERERERAVNAISSGHLKCPVYTCSRLPSVYPIIICCVLVQPTNQPNSFSEWK